MTRNTGEPQSSVTLVIPTVLRMSLTLHNLRWSACDTIDKLNVNVANQKLNQCREQSYI